MPHHLSPTGQRQRLHFDTREQARAHVRKLKGESGTGHTVADQQAIDAALATLAPTGATLLKAAEFYVAHLKQCSRSKTVLEAVEAWQVACVRRGLSERTLADYGRTMQALATHACSAAHLSTRYDFAQLEPSGVRH